MEAVVCAGNIVKRTHLHLRAVEIDDAEALRKLRVVRVHDAGVDVLRPGGLEILQNLVARNGRYGRFRSLRGGCAAENRGRSQEAAIFTPPPGKTCCFVQLS